jgi:hypothetical protein
LRPDRVKEVLLAQCSGPCRQPQGSVH